MAAAGVAAGEFLRRPYPGMRCSPAQSLGCLSQSHVSQRHVFQNIRPFFFALLLAVNLGFLGYFKYFDFFTGLLGRLAGRELMRPGTCCCPSAYLFTHSK